MAGCNKVQIRYVSGSKKNLVQYRGTFKVSLQGLANDNNEILCWSKSSGP